MKKELLYEGKAKQVYFTDQPHRLILSYKNEATAFNGKKQATIIGKGRFNNLISAMIFQYLAEHNLPSHFKEQLNDTEQLVEQTAMIPLEVVVRNLATGSIVQRLGFKESALFQPPLIELYYKDDTLDDPIINDQHALLLADITIEELESIKSSALRINDLLQAYFAKISVRLVDFKLEFGRNQAGDIILSDEISPDTCRLWDMATGERLDKDVFRQGTGELLPVYQKILDRLEASK